jgi:hypothetical protein
MSKFIDRLKQVFQPRPTPMGFRPINVEDTRPKIQLVAHLHNLPHDQVENLTAADAIVATEAKSFKSDILHGLWSAEGTFEEVDKAIEMGADFTIIPPNGILLPSDKQIGKILQINSSISDVLLRTVNDLPINAVLIQEDNETDGSITWQKLMLFRRFASMLTKPVLAPIPTTVTAAELQMVWETGLSGLIVNIKSTSDIEALGNLRKIISELKYPLPKKQDRPTPILPQAIAKAEKPEEPDEDDDDD